MKPALVCLIIPVMVSTAADLRAGQLEPAVSEFSERVSRYVDLHHAVGATLGPEAVSVDPVKRLEQKQNFAVAMRAARPHAVEGEVFTPEIADFLRARIMTAIRETRFDLVTALREGHSECDDETPCEPPALDVNDPFPWHAGPVMWPSLLWRLPPLPPEVEYRFLANDLVLIDIRAGLVVDILRAVLPAADPMTPRIFTPCDVHPDLPACWS